MTSAWFENAPLASIPLRALSGFLTFFYLRLFVVLLQRCPLWFSDRPDQAGNIDGDRSTCVTKTKSKRKRKRRKGNNVENKTNTHTRNIRERNDMRGTLSRKKSSRRLFFDIIQCARFDFFFQAEVDALPRWRGLSLFRSIGKWGKNGERWETGRRSIINHARTIM